ncbi:hypothetical protein Tco_0475497 [Tanacetum coccineum]
MNEKRSDSSKSEVQEESKEEVKKESKAELQKESKEDESKRKRNFGTRKKMKSRKRRYIQNTSEDDSDKENEELREDLDAVNQLVMDRFQDEIPEGFDRVLWGDLIVLFNSNDKDEFWGSQQDWKIESSGSYIALQEKVMMKMLKLKLESEEESTMALELIKFVKKLLAKVRKLRERIDGVVKGFECWLPPHNKWSPVHHA